MGNTQYYTTGRIICEHQYSRSQVTLSQAQCNRHLMIHTVGSRCPTYSLCISLWETHTAIPVAGSYLSSQVPLSQFPCIKGLRTHSWKDIAPRDL